MSTSSTSHRQTDQFWSANQPGFRFTDERPGSREFFAAVERHRYQLEPHIPEIVQFERWRDRDVLEVGCGIATDGINFARAGARYTGVDQSRVALALARQRFDLEKSSATLIEGRADRLPLPNNSFDLIYAHGVIHHMDNTAGAVSEFGRVLRPGGTALAMVYHRRSLNYWATIMSVRRALVSLLLIPAMPRLIARATGERASVLDGHRELLKAHGLRYLTDSRLFLSNNTDGPGNPLSKVFSREELAELFNGFVDATTTIRYLNLRTYPGLRRLERSPLGLRLARSIGWHLYVRAIKPAPSMRRSGSPGESA